MLRDRFDYPHGPEVTPDTRSKAKRACLALCDHHEDSARTLWKLVTEQCGGYMPHAAAVALHWASRTGVRSNLVPDVTAPVPR